MMIFVMNIMHVLWSTPVPKGVVPIMMLRPVKTTAIQVTASILPNRLYHICSSKRHPHPELHHSIKRRYPPSMSKHWPHCWKYTYTRGIYQKDGSYFGLISSIPMYGLSIHYYVVVCGQRWQCSTKMWHRVYCNYHPSQPHPIPNPSIIIFSAAVSLLVRMRGNIILQTLGHTIIRVYPRTKSTAASRALIRNDKYNNKVWIHRVMNIRFNCCVNHYRSISLRNGLRSIVPYMASSSRVQPKLYRIIITIVLKISRIRW